MSAVHETPTIFLPCNKKDIVIYYSNVFIFYYIMSCYVMSCYVMLCYVMLCYVMLCYVMLCYVMLCYVMLSETHKELKCVTRVQCS